MGQMTMAIMWGVRAPKGVALVTDLGDGIFDVWERECCNLIAAHDAKVQAWVNAKPGRVPWQRMSGGERYVPREEWDAGVCGFFVAVGASGRAGVPSLSEWQRPGYVPVAMSNSGVREAFPTAYRNARARWRRFREWCSAHRELHGAAHFATTAPSLWLVPTEVA